MNIVLIGYRCCGKTSTGQLIAERLDKKFVDTDALIIEKAGFSIDKIVSHHGWRYFRDIEAAVVKEVSSSESLVIATGGGVIMNEENAINLKKNGIVVWLYADVDIIKKRLEKDTTSDENRPSLTGDDPTDEIKKVLEQRESLYRDASDIAVDTSQLNINDAAGIIIDNLDEIVEKKKRLNDKEEIKNSSQ